LNRIRAGEIVRICSLGHVLPPFIRYAARYRYDCVWFDLEHRAFDEREVQAMLALFQRYDLDCMVRPSTLDRAKLYRLLEDGATGLMIPHVSTVEKARSVVGAAKFPPIGDRGLDGAGLDGDFYVDFDQAAYTQAANAETFVIVQIETPEAVRNADAIAAIDGIDGLFIGPGDLGLRLKATPGVELTLDEATRTVAAAARKHGKAWGRPAASFESMKQLKDQGAQLIAHGSEYAAIIESLCAASRLFDQLDV
jgi:2-keto-3-deoxy-L-rhamnonate aldolase RhmA